MTATATNPADLGAVEARRMIGRRDLSPVELAEACIARVRAIDPAVNAVVAHDFDRLLDAARAAEAAVASGAPLGPLHGLPVAVKDERHVAGLPTTFGSPLYEGIVAERDDPLVAGLRAAGALILGKTNLSEWSAGANTRNRVHGVTVNPYDRSRSAAGSSGGSAVALACRMAPLATGSDLGGSLRNPAAFCGVAGFRPTAGRVPDPRREMALLPLSTDGPMARSPEDAALLFSVLDRSDSDDPWSGPAGARGVGLDRESTPVGTDLSALRVAMSADLGFAPTEQGVRETFRDRMDRLRPHLGAVEADAPDCAGADRAFSVLRGLLFLGDHARRVAKTPDSVGPNVHANVAEAVACSASDVAEALVLQGAHHRSWTAFFRRFDILLCPAVTISPRPWPELFPAQIDGTPTRSYYHWLALAYAVSVAGHPAVSIPCGLDAAGLPFGLQVVGRRGDDLRLLAIAQALTEVIEGSAGLATPPPDLDALSKASPIASVEGFRSL